MSRARSVRHKKRRFKREAMEIDITSLLDILVILLVFLLKSYNTSGLQLQLPEGLSLASSKSLSQTRPALMVHVTKEKIWVEDQEIEFKDSRSKKVVDLYDHLIKRKQEIQRVASVSTEANKFDGVVNLIVDKDVGYKSLRKIMHTCAEAGYLQYKLVVMKEDAS